MERFRCIFSPDIFKFWENYRIQVKREDTDIDRIGIL